MDDKARILDFISSRQLMVISTVDRCGKPESAVVGFGHTEKLELIFGTSIDSRKAQNILANDRVSVVIGWDKEGTVQYEGVARKLEGEEEVESYTESYFQKAPFARRLKDRPGQTYFVISPTWVRFTDVTSDPWGITELTF